MIEAEGSAKCLDFVGDVTDRQVRVLDEQYACYQPRPTCSPT